MVAILPMEDSFASSSISTNIRPRHGDVRSHATYQLYTEIYYRMYGEIPMRRTLSREQVETAEDGQTGNASSLVP